MNSSKNMYQPIEGLHDEEPVADGQARHARGYRLSAHHRVKLLIFIKNERMRKGREKG